MRLTASHCFLPKTATTNAAVVMDHFGLGFETGQHVIAEDFELPLCPGQVVLFTGPSGSGKSTLMQAAARQLTAAQPAATPDAPYPAVAPSLRFSVAPSLRPSVSPSSAPPLVHSKKRPDASPCPSAPLPPGPSVPRPSSRDHRPTLVDINALPLDDRLLVDALDLPPHESLPLLAACGLGEARLLLRTAAELSDGQLYRFRLALALSKKPDWIVADEFTATLDRTLAKIIAYNVRRQADRTGTGFLFATTHEDVAADLDPDLHVQCRLDGAPTLIAKTPNEHHARNAAPSVSPSLRHSVSNASGPEKKSARSRSSPNSNSPPARNATTRISLGGITAPTTSASSGS